MTETSFSRGTRALVDHPLAKLLERVAIGGIAFLSIWTFNQIAHITATLPALSIRLDNIERRVDEDRASLAANGVTRGIVQQDVVQRLTRLETQGEYVSDNIKGLREDFRLLVARLDDKP